MGDPHSHQEGSMKPCFSICLSLPFLAVGAWDRHDMDVRRSVESSVSVRLDVPFL